MSLISDVRYLIHRHHSPLVEVRPSYIPNAGIGVFVKRPIEKDRVVCLYPGIYTPGIPKYAAESVETVNLADKEPPSGGDIESNPYILNLNIQGGYIDGSALIGVHGRRLDDNPSACANMINHSKDANVDWMPIHWNEVLDDLGYQDEHKMPLPNELRADGSPWYYDGFSEKVVSFPSSVDKGESTTLLLYGAALYAKRDMEYGEEILLDYKLKGPPYPAWAQDWYE